MPKWVANIHYPRWIYIWPLEYMDLVLPFPSSQLLETGYLSLWFSRLAWNYSVTQTGLELETGFVPQIPKCQNYMCILNQKLSHILCRFLKSGQNGGRDHTQGSSHQISALLLAHIPRSLFLRRQSITGQPQVPDILVLVPSPGFKISCILSSCDYFRCKCHSVGLRKKAKKESSLPQSTVYQVQKMQLLPSKTKF